MKGKVGISVGGCQPLSSPASTSGFVSVCLNVT